jgi:hypothetical protein
MDDLAKENGAIALSFLGYITMLHTYYKTVKRLGKKFFGVWRTKP